MFVCMSVCCGRPYNKLQHLNASVIRSGDYLAIARLDGLDPMIMFGTGGRTGHSAVRGAYDQGCRRLSLTLEHVVVAVDG